MGEFSQFALVPEQGVTPEKGQLVQRCKSASRRWPARLGCGGIPAAVQGVWRQGAKGNEHVFKPCA